MEFVKGFLIGALIVGVIMYFVGSNNPYPAAKRKLLAKASDAIKKVIPILVLLFMFSSCSNHYNNSISGKGIAQQCPMRPLDQLTRDSAKEGLLVIDSSHAGNPSICATTIILKKTVWQNWGDLINGGGRLVWAIIGLVVAIGCLSLYITRTSKGAGGYSELFFIGGMFIGLVIVACSIYAFSDETEITIAQYQQMMNKDGNTQAAWNNPPQTH